MDEANRAAGPALVDCEAGRRIGCGTFCCRLIVRLDPEERVSAEGCPTLKNCLDKDPADGWCVHLDRQTHRCEMWDRRPRVCREYDCNRDPLLQVVLQRGGGSLVELINAKVDASRPPRSVPTLDGGCGEEYSGTPGSRPGPPSGLWSPEGGMR